MKKVLPDGYNLIPEDAECVFTGVLYDVFQWQQKLFDGSYATFEMLRRPDTVLAICVDDNSIVMLDAEQSGLKRKKSFPGGRVDVSDMSIYDAVQREIKEETGMEFASWKLIDVVQPTHKIEWFIYTFVATGKIVHKNQQLDPGEKISVSQLSFEEVKQLVSSEDSLKFSKEIFSSVDFCNSYFQFQK